MKSHVKSDVEASIQKTVILWQERREHNKQETFSLKVILGKGIHGSDSEEEDRGLMPMQLNFLYYY